MASHAAYLEWLFFMLLAFAAVYDILFQKIRNWLVFLVLIVGFVTQWNSGTVSGFYQSLGGLLLGFIAFLPFYAKKAMAAGDVKLMAAVGAMLGYSYILYAVAATLIAGGVMAMLTLLLKGEIGDFFKRWFIMARHFMYTRKILWVQPSKGSVAAGYFPYAAAIACGSLITLWFSSLRPSLG